MEDLKDRACRVCESPEAYDELEHKRVETQTDYTMPDGLTLTVGHESVKAPEFLFRPELGLTSAGVQGHFATAMSSVPQEQLPELLNNVVLSGGTTLTSGFQQRALWELSNTMGGGVRVLAKPERKYLSWIGTSIVATLSTYQDSWMSAGEFAEVGTSLARRKGMFTGLRADESAVLEDPFFAPPKVQQPVALEAPEPVKPRVANAHAMSLWRAAIEGDLPNTLAALEGAAPDVVNAADPHNQGFSALHFAARYGNADIIKVLCDAGADVAATDDFGRIPLHWAAEYDRAPVTIGSSTSPLIEATQHLLVAGSDVTARDEAGRTPLQYAARAGQAEVMNLLIAAGADVDAPDKSFRTPRDWASSAVVDSLPPPKSSS